MFSPEISVRMKNGTTFTENYPYSRMEWTLDQLVIRLGESAPNSNVRRARFDALIAAVRGLDGEADISRLLTAASLV